MSVQDLFDLTGKVALVTGGSRGLGKEIAGALAEAGARIVITARRAQWLDPTAVELAARGYDCLALIGDVSSEESVAEIVGQTVERFGRIDILFNNAGASWGAPAIDLSLEKWRSVFEVNATGTFIVSQQVARVMIGHGGGKIVNLASIAGLSGVDPEIMTAVAYNASKGAVVALTRTLATNWAQHGITVNAIAPGFFPTRMSEGIIARGEQSLLQQIPLRRLGQPDDLRGLAVFLASAASDYITGQTIVVDGGLLAI